jgi:hypothetical protein
MGIKILGTVHAVRRRVRLNDESYRMESEAEGDRRYFWSADEQLPCYPTLTSPLSRSFVPQVH